MIADTTNTEQIYQRADQAIAEARNQIAEIVGHIDQIQDNLSALAQTHETRHTALEQTRALTVQCESEYNQAEQYLKLVAGTPREEQALASRAESKKRLDGQKKELHKREREVAEADKQDKPHEQELTSALKELHTEQERLEKEIQGLELAKQQAFQEEGYERYTQALVAYQEKQSLVEDLEARLTAAKVEAFECYTQALESLKNWPIHRKSIQHLRAPDDATIRAFKMNIAYYQLIEQDVEQIEAPFLPSLQRGMVVESVYDRLLLGEDISRIKQQCTSRDNSLYHSGQYQAQIEGVKATIRTQRHYLEKLLAEYIAYKHK